MVNLLTDPAIPVDVTELTRPKLLTLPDLFAHLASDTVDGFPGLAAHQEQAWYQFVAQLGALALHRRNLNELPDDVNIWLALLSDLTPDCNETAWSLIVEDSTKPAFLQPPTSRIDAFKLAAETPDALDILVTAKNHDRKQAQASHAAPHLWLYALLTLQTTQGYSGRGQPGIARMNGGFSSRVLVDRRPDARWGHRVDRAIRMLLHQRETVLARVGDAAYRQSGGLGLTWLRAWDTDVPLSVMELDPYFIEVCRRVRLTITSGGRVGALVRPAGKPRVEAQALKGNLGDPWVPINLGKSEPSALTVGGGGFDYRLAQRILFDKDLKQPLALRKLPGEERGDTEIHMAVLVRGQGKTEGLQQRVIPLPRSIAVRLSFGADDEEFGEQTAHLADLSRDMVEAAGEARRVLRQAVLVYLQGPENPNFQKRDASPVVTRYDRVIDEQFFDRLFAALEVGADEVVHDWHRFLRDEARRLAGEVWDRTAPPSARREKSRAASEAVLLGGLRRRLPLAFPEDDAKETSA